MLLVGCAASQLRQCHIYYSWGIPVHVVFQNLTTMETNNERGEIESIDAQALGRLESPSAPEYDDGVPLPSIDMEYEEGEHRNVQNMRPEIAPAPAFEESPSARWDREATEALRNLYIPLTESEQELAFMLALPATSRAKRSNRRKMNKYMKSRAKRRLDHGWITRRKKAAFLARRDEYISQFNAAAADKDYCTTQHDADCEWHLKRDEERIQRPTPAWLLHAREAYAAAILKHGAHAALQIQNATARG